MSGISDIDRSSFRDISIRDFSKKQNFLYKFGWKVIDSVAQSINRLCWVS